MKFLITRKVFDLRFVISELHIDGVFVTHIKETIHGGNLNMIKAKGDYKVVQFFSAKRKRIVYGVGSKRGMLSKEKYYVLQNGGDFDTIKNLKFPYTFSQKKYVLKIS